jgi:hypothetical protein
MKQYTWSGMMTEQLMRHMIYVIVVEICGHHNTLILSEMFLIPLRPPRTKSDLYPLGGCSPLEHV